MNVTEGIRRVEDAEEREVRRQGIARRLILPTRDDAVRAQLRRLGEPTCLFGEVAKDRRERLRDVLSERALTLEGKKDAKGDEDFLAAVDVQMGEAGDLGQGEAGEASDEDSEAEFFTVGSTDGAAAPMGASTRLWRTSLVPARRRLQLEAAWRALGTARLRETRACVFGPLARLSLVGSQVGA